MQAPTQSKVWLVLFQLAYITTSSLAHEFERRGGRPDGGKRARLFSIQCSMRRRKSQLVERKRIQKLERPRSNRWAGLEPTKGAVAVVRGSKLHADGARVRHTGNGANRRCGMTTRDARRTRPLLSRYFEGRRGR